MVFKLNNLVGNPGSTRGKIRLGRGIGSGKGKTCGRGGKGQTARRGVSINGFEGGQTPIHRRLPKRGFYNYSRLDFDTVNLSDLQKAIDDKKLKAGAISFENLIDANLIKGRQDGVKLLGTGKVSAKLELHVHKASASAVKAIEAAGGKVSIIEPKVRKFEKKSEKKEAKPKTKKASK